MYVGTSSGSTKEVQFVGESSGSLINGNISLGSVVTLWYTDMLWRIVHIDETNNEVVLAKHLVGYSRTFNDIKKSVYKDSDIASECMAFLNVFPQIIQDHIIPKTVHDVTAKVWIPQVNWISNNEPSSYSGTNNEWTLFDYFSTGGIAYTVNDIHGNSCSWWTASDKDNDNVVWTVRPPNISYDSSNISLYFRPFICLPLS